MPAVAHGAEAAHQAGGDVTARLEIHPSFIERILKRFDTLYKYSRRRSPGELACSTPRPHLTAYRVIDPTTASPSPWRSFDDAPRAESRPVRDVCRRVLALARGRRAPGRRARARDPPSARPPRDRARRVGAASSPPRERAKGTSRGSDRFRRHLTRRARKTSTPRCRPRRCPRSPPRRRCGRTSRRTPRCPPRRASTRSSTSTPCAPLDGVFRVGQKAALGLSGRGQHRELPSFDQRRVDSRAHGALRARVLLARDGVTVHPRERVGMGASSARNLGDVPRRVVFMVGANFILLGSTKVVAILAIYHDLSVGLVPRFRRVARHGHTRGGRGDARARVF